MNSHFHALIASVIALGCLCLTVGCRPQSASRPSEVLASVGETVIRVTDLEAELNRRAARGQRPDPRQVLDELILREALVARAYQMGLDHEPDVVRGYKSLLISELKKRELEPRFHTATNNTESLPTDAPKSEPHPMPMRIHQVHLAILRQQIHIKTSDAKIQRIKSQLEEARAKALQLPATERGFGSLAIDYSDDQSSRYQGGDLGWLSEDAGKLNLDPAVISAAAQLKTAGEISPIIRGQDGLYVVRLLDRRAVASISNAETDALAQHQAHLEKRKQVERDFEQNARASVSITVNEENLARLKDLAANPAQEGAIRKF